MDNKVDKLWKKAVRDQQKRLKPGECEKYVRLVLDAGLVATALGQELLAHLNAPSAQLKYEIRPLAERHCIVWERSVGQRQLIVPSAEPDADLASGGLDDEWQMENHVLRLLSAKELQEAIKNQTLDMVGAQLRLAFPGRRHTVVVTTRSDHKNAAAALIELEMLQQVAVQQLPGAGGVGELLALLRRFTRAIAEAPYKQQKGETQEGFKKYLANDKKQCVRVVGTQGFGRLWQQHLNRLPQVTLEVAEAVIAQYSCPKRLLAAYARDADGAPNLIADLKINRGAPQALASDRRIGNVLSGKLHALYTTRDPQALI